MHRREFFLVSMTSIATSFAILDAKKHPTAHAQQAPDPELEFYFKETGHHLSGEFLALWRQNRNGLIFGPPITEVMVNKAGLKTQYFENVRLEQNPESPDRIVLGDLGRERFERSSFSGWPSQMDERFAHFMSKYSVEAGRAISPVSPHINQEDEVQFFQYTSKVTFVHQPTVMPEFYRNEINLWEKELQRTLRLLWPEEIKLFPLGALTAKENHLDTEGIPQRPTAQVYSTAYFNSRKRIDVDLTEQALTAYEGDTTILQAPISSGKPGFETVTGRFSVLSKIPSMRYQSPFPDLWDYDVPNVPFNLRFFDGYNIHGTYWHDEFGVRKGYGRSAGCVNLDMYDAGWLYNWAPLGARVNVHY